MLILYMLRSGPYLGGHRVIALVMLWSACKAPKPSKSLSLRLDSPRQLVTSEVLLTTILFYPFEQQSSEIELSSHFVAGGYEDHSSHGNVYLVL